MEVGLEVKAERPNYMIASREQLEGKNHNKKTSSNPSKIRQSSGIWE
jgi:hypothetical protein